MTDNGKLLPDCLIVVLETAIDNETHSDDELAVHLCLSPASVHTYWGRICVTLGVHNRFQAIVRALELGIVTLKRERERERERRRRMSGQIVYVRRLCSWFAITYNFSI
jgi:DNA-binding CsgD family transcriptional regulator